MTRPAYVYVASSWRNPMQPAVCATLTAAGIDHYDFRHPRPGESGFSWRDIMPSFSIEEQLADVDEYVEALQHPIAAAGFRSDLDAMKRADACVLVLPCGRSAHLELGWCEGQGKRTAILLDPDDANRVTPELMYRLVDYVAPTLLDLLRWLGVEDEESDVDCDGCHHPIAPEDVNTDEDGAEYCDACWQNVLAEAELAASGVES